MKLAAVKEVGKASFSQWSEDKAPRLAAALAFYTIFALAPFLLIVVGLIGLFLGRESAQSQLFGALRGSIGASAASGVQGMLTSLQAKQGANTLALIVGLAVALFTASGLFGQLQDALNTVWHVKLKSGLGIWGFLRSRFVSFATLMGVAFLLLVSLLVSAGVQAFSHWLGHFLPGQTVILGIIDFVVSLAVTTVLFAAIFKVLPDAEIAWGDVWVGAFITAALFSIGKLLIGLYLGRSAVASTYGAAGALVLLLLWVYYSAQLLLLGAEFTRAYATRYGSGVKPEAEAEATAEAGPDRHAQPEAA